MVVLANVSIYIFIHHFQIISLIHFSNLENLNSIKKRFSFLNPSWAALKYFDEQQFLRIVQGQGSINSSQVLGRLPRKLELPGSHQQLDVSHHVPPLQHTRTKSQSTLTPSFSTSSARNVINRQKSAASSLGRGRSFSQSQTNVKRPLPPRSELSKTSISGSSQRTQSVKSSDESNTSLQGLLFEHFTYGGEGIQLFQNQEGTIKTATHIERSCSLPSPPLPNTNNVNPTQAKPQISTYDQDFKLSPPPKRRPSLSSSFDAMTFYDTGPNQLSRSPSISSVLQYM
jgi:hypothetical protein